MKYLINAMMVCCTGIAHADHMPDAWVEFIANADSSAVALMADDRQSAQKYTMRLPISVIKRLGRSLSTWY